MLKHAFHHITVPPAKPTPLGSKEQTPGPRPQAGAGDMEVDEEAAGEPLQRVHEDMPQQETAKATEVIQQASGSSVEAPLSGQEASQEGSLSPGPSDEAMDAEDDDKSS